MLSTLIPLLPLALALPLESRDATDFDITALHASLPVNSVYGSGPIASSLGITVTVGSDLSTTCSFNWPKETAPGPFDWTACADATVSWRLPASGWTSDVNFVVDVYQATSGDATGAGLYASRHVDSNPGNSSDPDAYISCIEYGKFQPLTCQLDGPLSIHSSPIVMAATEESSRPL
ncbi:hypothetical protein F4778DRAFT_783019 [Xylariomycetidae sp. FL2044]|nr:hypothetical protein F4778DRAFT_783019 [Xylariomycetidae sp. FL2044]